MKRNLWILLALIAAAAGVAIVFWRSHRQTRWTTDSPAALTEFRRGLEAEMKYYHEEALAHYEKASALDPAFTMARLKVLESTPWEKKERSKLLLEELRKTDLGRLNPRERFLVSYHLARADKENAKAEKILIAYLKEEPDDPFALSIRCEQAWSRHDWAEAESYNRRLLAIDPNWVQAQNRLGYTAMAQGRFGDAEQLFRTYLYIAPDQANPHDSMGELWTLLGRYDDAQRELEEAVRIKPDFCASWLHMAEINNLSGRPEESRRLIDGLQQGGGCSKEYIAGIACRSALWRAAGQGDWATVWARSQDSPCKETTRGEASILSFRSAVFSGHRAEAETIEQDFEKETQLYEGEKPMLGAALAYMQGLRLAVDGDLRGATERLRKTDAGLAYWGDNQGIFKLVNRLDLAHVLRESGDVAGAERLIAEVRAVNPDLAARLAPVWWPQR